MKFLLVVSILSCCQWSVLSSPVAPNGVGEVEKNEIGEGAGVIERSQELSQKLTVSWTIDFGKDLAVFTLTAQSHGFIGFGVSPQGGMNNADVIIGGVNNDGTPYFTDRYSTTKSEPKIDDHQDWFLLDAMENSTHTILRFNRSINSCDPEDLAFTNDTTKFIWALGETDDITYHAERGVVSVNILDEATDDVDTSKFDVWHITVNTTIPTAGTSYWCTVHKMPDYPAKRHIVGFKVKLENEGSLTHNHHLVLHKCHGGVNDTEHIRSFLNSPGGECYNEDGTGMKEIAKKCNTFYFVWAKGGLPLFLPSNVGIPLGEDGTDEFFLLEIHYDNPKVLAGVSYETGLEVYTASELRKEDAGLLTVGSAYHFTLLIPPASKNLVIAGQCSSHCTEKKMPEEGINIFNVLLHSHLSGRKLKLRHFRPDDERTGNFTELPWISYDNNYDFDYQQNRPLSKHVKVKPGDHLTYECTYDSTWKKTPSVTLGGLQTYDEMCESFILYYPRIKSLDICGSQVPIHKMLKKFGIEEIDIKKAGHRDPLIVKPAEMEGKKISEVLNALNWTAELKEEWQQISRYESHDEICYGFGTKRDPTNKTVAKLTSYPSYTQEFQLPAPKCL